MRGSGEGGGVEAGRVGGWGLRVVRGVGGGRSFGDIRGGVFGMDDSWRSGCEVGWGGEG